MTILIAGVFCPQGRVASLIDSGDFDSVLRDVRAMVSEADYRIVNFECPVCSGVESPLEKQGPNLSCTGKGVEAIKRAGFDCVTLANNHFYDYGDAGVKNTIEKCAEVGLDTVGGGMSLKEASAILYKKIEDKTLAVINCCEHEFSIASDNHGGSGNVKFDYFDADFNHLDLVQTHPMSGRTIPKPVCFEEMKDIAGRLSQGIPHVRIDLYEVRGHIYFGEYTFYHHGGCVPFHPQSWDFVFGSWITLKQDNMISNKSERLSPNRGRVIIRRLRSLGITPCYADSFCACSNSVRILEAA